MSDDELIVELKYIVERGVCAQAESVISCLIGVLYLKNEFIKTALMAHTASFAKTTHNFLSNK